MATPNNPNRCLLCYSDKVNPNPNGSPWVISSPSATFPGGPNSTFDTIFLLQNLLEVPREKIDEYLQHYGSPEHWVKLCSNCSGVVGQANSIYQQLLQISKLFKETKRKIVDTVKRSTGFVSPGSIVCVKDMVVTEESRRFASQIDMNRLIMEANGNQLLHQGGSQAGMGGEYPPLSYFKALQDNLQIITEESGASNSNTNSNATANGKVKPYQCSTCGTSFTQKGNLTRHVENVHKRSHRFSCNQCGKFWTKNSDLKKHFLKVHRITVPSGATAVNFQHHGQWTNATTSTSTKSLKKRRKTKKYFECEVCHVTFTQKGNLQRHTENVHNNLKFGCTICGVTLSKQSDLQRHMNTVHRTGGGSSATCQ